MNTRLSPDQDRLPLEREARARDKDDRLSDAHPLGHYRDVSAWVLLADPGAGKSDVFTTLALSEGGFCISARDFVDLGLPVNWHEPLFIDALDEITSGPAPGMTPLGQIRQKLQQLGIQKFRISCREADWRGDADGEALKRLVGNDNFAELHLTLLSHAQSVALIAHWQASPESQAEAFMQEAQRRDLEGLLDNPQTLSLLVTAIGGTGNPWPASKTQTYEMACAQLVREHNDEHLANSRDSTPPDDQTLLAAGYLCAVILLSGSAAIALQRQNQSRAGVVILPELNNTATASDLRTCRVALHTSLFRCTSRSGEFVPVHRTVAEYLGAHYLASRIHADLPASRVLALMLGEDGGLVPELRGLHAWLAAVAPTNLRRELIAHDPLGVVLNGDVRAFLPAEKRALLDALQQEASQDPSFRRGNWASHSFGALATADMEENFKALLQSPDRSPVHQELLGCVLDAMEHGQHMTTLASVLVQVVRDKTYKTDVRTRALRVLIRDASHNASWPLLMQLLTDIHSNTLEDPEDELLGTLLQALYPDHLSPAELLQHFSKPKIDSNWGSYKCFWLELSTVKTPQTNTPSLLDALSASGFQIGGDPDDFDSGEIVGNLLVWGVKQDGLRVAIPRLYNWLSLGLGMQDHSQLTRSQQTELAQWLGSRSDIYKKLFEHGLQLSQSKEDADYSTFQKIRATLYQAPEPEDVVSWYLEMANTTTQTVLRRTLVNESFQKVWKNKGLDAAQQLLQVWLSKHPHDAACFDIFLHNFPPSKTTQKGLDRNLQQKTKDEEVARQRLLFFRKALPSFEDGPPHLGALIEVAETYLSNLQRISRTTPDTRLLKLLNQDPELVRLALHGLRQCLFTGELPSAEDILQLEAKSQHYSLATPCLAAMALRETENSATALDLPDATLAMVAAFQLTDTFQLGTLFGEPPSWFKRLLARQPSVVARLMLKRISAQIAFKKEHISGIDELVHNADYAEVAKQIILPLISTLPAKANKALLPALRALILVAMRHLAPEALSQLIADKLKNKTLDVAQHVYWLTAGLLLAPNLYLEPMRKYIGHNQTRIHHVFDFLNRQRGANEFQINLTPAAQIFLIGLLGPKSSPSAPRSGVYDITPENEIGDYVGGLIASLASTPDDEATQALTNLHQRHDMKQWQDTLKRVLYDQRIARRKALFKPATVKQVCNTLANLQPANAADLWALTVAHLEALIGEIRNGNTNDYRQYWANDTPRLEDDCRDTLLSDLKQRLLRLGVVAEPEGRYADERRADIKVIAPPHHIPIEIKREKHADLWKAIGNQLIAKYGRESTSDGYGIYLIFWFTGDMKAGATDGGRPPKTQQELQQRLAATIPETLKHKIAVLVIDCSKPSSTKPI